MKKIKIIIIILLVLALIPIIINFYVINKSKNNIYSSIEINKKYDIALVLGCKVKDSKTPNKMLQDRLDKAIELYNNNLVDSILISGDHTAKYSELNVMEYYLLQNDIPKEDILYDYIGNSTHESLINFKNNFEDKTVIIVTQKYHLYRALYIADDLHINGIGVHAELITYYDVLYNEIREFLARNKDFLLFLFK